VEPEAAIVEGQAPAPLKLYVAWALVVAWWISLGLAGLGAP
jgi:hypothetical protein